MKNIIMMSVIALSGNFCYAQSATADHDPVKPFKVEQAVPRQYTGQGTIKQNLGTVKKGTVSTVFFPVVFDYRNNNSGAGDGFPFKASDIVRYNIPEHSGIRNVSLEVLRGRFSLNYVAGQTGPVNDVVEVFTRNEGTIYLRL